MPKREDSVQLLNKYIKSPSLINHCSMVATAMDAYAKKLGLTSEEIDEWWFAGLLHDLDWEMYPDQHPNKACNEILPENGYSNTVIDAIRAHAPDRTGKTPNTPIEKYLFACDEISGFMYAASLVRPTGFQGMEVKSITKRLKEKSFAANVSREDVYEGAKLIDTPLEDHIMFLLSVFSK